MKYDFLYILTFYLATSLVFSSFGQQDSIPLLKSKTHEISLGETFQVSLEWKHPAEQEVFFPRDKSHFLPFKLVGLKPLETITENGTSKDEVQYELMTFEVDDIQTLSLPVWYMEDGDSVRLVSNVDTLFYNSIIADSVLDKSEFKWDPFWIKPKTGTNHWAWVKWVLLVLSFLLILIFFLRKTIERSYLIWKFGKRQQAFALKFRKSMKEAEDLNNSVALWKEHMEWLDKIPYTSLSTSEITLRTENERLGEALKKVDAAIYGGEHSEQLLLALQILYNESNLTFRKRKKEFIKSLKNK